MMQLKEQIGIRRRFRKESLTYLLFKTFEYVFFEYINYQSKKLCDIICAGYISLLSK